MNKKLLISIIIIIAIVAGIIAAKYLGKERLIPSEKSAVEEEPSAESLAKEDSTASINQMLEETEELDLDKEFQSLDAELQNL